MIAVLLSVLFFWGSLALVPGKNFDHIFFMVFENTALSSAVANADFANFAQGGLLYTNYFATFHPSQPNYIDMIAGQRYGCVDDNLFNTDGVTLIDLLEAKGVSWKFYQELYPTPGQCFLGMCSGGSNGCKYVRRHNPIISILSTQNNSARCANIVDENVFATDLSSGNLPQYSFYTPDLDNDGHDTGVAFAGSFLTKFFTGKTFPAKTLIVITFDEDDSAHNNNIYHLLKGPGIPSGQNAIQYNHYSMLRTIEDNWNLGTLGAGDATAQVMSFVTTTSAPTVPTSTNAPIAVVPTGGSPAPTVEPATQVPTAPVVVNVTWTFIDGKTRLASDVTALCRGGLRNTTVFAVRQGFKKRDDMQAGNDTWTAAIISTDSTTNNWNEAANLAAYLQSSAFTNVVNPGSVLIDGASPQNNQGAVIAVAVILSLVAVVLIILIIATIVYFKKKKGGEKEDYSMY